MGSSAIKLFFYLTGRDFLTGMLSAGTAWKGGEAALFARKARLAFNTIF
jgi:hypothetical protein